MIAHVLKVHGTLKKKKIYIRHTPAFCSSIPQRPKWCYRKIHPNPDAEQSVDDSGGTKVGVCIALQIDSRRS